MVAGGKDVIVQDEHEFIMQREHVLASSTVKAMLSGPGAFAESETNEAHFSFSYSLTYKAYYR